MADTFARRVADSISTHLSTLLNGVLSLKNFPGIWHVRVLRGMYYQLYFQPTAPNPQDVFKPLITSTTNSLFECDFNWHKSNSTYFSDLDVSRSHLMSCICRGITRLKKGEDQHTLPARIVQAPGTYQLVLAGLACHFHRQVEPLANIEIWTRILCWDHRAIYCVSHIIKKGAMQPTSYALQPWKRSYLKDTEGTGDDFAFNNCVYASSIARYVVRKGSAATIKPEIVLQLSQLLPPRPAEGGTTDSASNIRLTDTHPHADVVLGASHEWTWEDMERERVRGMEIATHFDALGELHGEFRGSDVLGHFGDYW